MLGFCLVELGAQVRHHSVVKRIGCRCSSIRNSLFARLLAQRHLSCSERVQGAVLKAQ